MSEWIFLDQAARARRISRVEESQGRCLSGADSLPSRRMRHPFTGRMRVALRLPEYMMWLDNFLARGLDAATADRLLAAAVGGRDE